MLGPAPPKALCRACATPPFSLPQQGGDPVWNLWAPDQSMVYTCRWRGCGQVFSNLEAEATHFGTHTAGLGPRSAADVGPPCAQTSIGSTSHGAKTGVKHSRHSRQAAMQGKYQLRLGCDDRESKRRRMRDATENPNAPSTYSKQLPSLQQLELTAAASEVVEDAVVAAALGSQTQTPEHADAAAELSQWHVSRNANVGPSPRALGDLILAQEAAAAVAAHRCCLPLLRLVAACCCCSCPVGSF